MPDIIIIHENGEWLPPFQKAFADAGLSFDEWHLAGGSVDLGANPLDAIYSSRMSASGHSRGHSHAPGLAQAVLNWLEQHWRTVLNGSCALYFETSKVAQYTALAAAGIAALALSAVAGMTPGSVRLAKAIRARLAAGQPVRAAA